MHSATPALRLIVSVFIAVACLSLAVPIASAQRDPGELLGEGLVRLADVEAGALLLETDEPGWYVPAPTLHTDIDIAVSGPIARAVITQRFRNVAEVFVEGKYVFPMPEGAAVDSLRMRVGDRWIQGSIAEREEARLVYEEAKANGQVASLVEQERPNVFTTSVANIGPGAQIIVQIEYQQSLAPRDGNFNLRVPLVVAPRYTPPGADTQGNGPSGDPRSSDTESGQRTEVSNTRIPDSTAVSGPVEISVDLNAGFPLGVVTSEYHDIDIERRIENAADITVVGAVPANRDFLLSWKPDPLSDPYAAMFTESRDGDTHYVAMLTPPAASAIDDTRVPREVIFVQDTSGSMGGDSIIQAKAGLIAALERLDPGDVFNIIEFNSAYSTFAIGPVQATPRNIDRAVRFVEGLQATGGTEMLPALETALDDDTPRDGRLRQVIFLTDGAVSNERQMLKLIETDLGNTRLFTVGIGSAPNSYFMTAAANAGRGSFVFIGDLNEVDEQMQALFEKIETPAVVDITTDGFPSNAEVTPFPIPDLYAGDPIVLTVRVPQGVETDSLRLTGQRGQEDWHVDLVLADAEIRPGVSKLWAREVIRDLEALRVSPEVDQDRRESIDDEILATALEFGLVSRLTSLVAVDVQITRPADAEQLGWDRDTFFIDPAAQTSPVTSDDISDAALGRLNAADALRTAAADADAGVAFAATGADWQLRAIFGLGLLAIGIVPFIRPRRPIAEPERSS